MTAADSALAGLLHAFVSIPEEAGLAAPRVSAASPRVMQEGVPGSVPPVPGSEEGVTVTSWETSAVWPAELVTVSFRL